MTDDLSTPMNNVGTQSSFVEVSESSKPSLVDVCVQTDCITPSHIYEGFFNKMSHPLLIIDMNSNMEKAMSHILNPAANELIKSCGKYFYQGSKLEKFDGSLSDFIWSMKGKVQQKINYSDTIRIPAAARSKSVYSLTSSVFDVDKEIRVLGIILIEISKTVEQELSAVENFKASLISALSHELNNPMNTLIPILEIISKNDIEAIDDNLRKMAVTNIYLLQRKIRDLIDYASMELGDMKLIQTEFCLNDMFEEIKEIFKLEMDHKSNIFITKIESNCQKMILFTDKNRLEQVLIKLVSNANKFTNKGIINLTAKECKQDFNVFFSIKDTGVGISKEKQEIIFAPVNHKDKYQSKFARLPGLGLEIAKGLCKCMNSKLNVTSEEGKGSNFSFELPTCQLADFDSLVSLTRIKESKARNRLLNNKKTCISTSNLLITFLDEIIKLRGPIMKPNNILKEDKKNQLSIKHHESSNLKNSSEILSMSPKLPWESDHTVLDEKSEICNKLKKYSDFNKIKATTNEKIPIEPKVRKQLVLVTDDVYSNRMVIKTMLNNLKVSAIEAINGEDAVSIIKKFFCEDSEADIQLILMDLSMPVMDGIEATVEIRKLEKSNKRKFMIPIIAVTAHNGTSDKNACFKAGMQDYVLKPVSTRVIKSIMQKYAADMVL